MEQDANSETSTTNSQDTPLAPEIESKSSDASLSSSTESHHQSPSRNEELTPDHEQSTAIPLPSTPQSHEVEPSLPLLPDPQNSSQSDNEQSPASNSPFTPQLQEGKPALSLLPHPQPSPQSTSESEKPSSSLTDSLKPKSDLSYKTGTGLLPFPSMPPIPKRPPLLPFPPMRLPMRHQPLRPNIIHKNIRPSQRPGLLPTPQRPFQSSFMRIPMLDMQQNASTEASNVDSKSNSTERHLTPKPNTTMADSNSTPTLSSLPPFFRYSILQDIEEPPPPKARKNSQTTDPSHLVSQNFVNPNQNYFPYNYPYQNNGYFPHMYPPGFLPPPGYFHQTSPSIPPTYSVPRPPPLPPVLTQPPLPPDPPKPPPPPPIYPTPPSPLPIHTTSPPPSPPSPQQLYPPPSPEIPTPPFQSSPFNPIAISLPNTSNASSSSSLVRPPPPPPPPPQLAGDDKFFSSFTYPEYLESSETSTPEILLDHIPLPQ